MDYTKTELAELIKTVETEFGGYLAKSEAAAAAPLTKAEDAKPEEKKEEKPSEEKKEAKPESKEEGKAESKEAPKAEAKAPEHKEEGKEAAPAPEARAEGKEAAPEEHGYDDEDMEHMHSMYSSMSPAERKAHHDAIMKCAQAEQAPEQAMAKSETTSTVEVKVENIQTQPEALLKSELEAEKAKSAELKKNLDGVKEFLTALVKQVPKGKAITSLDVVAKSEGQEEKQMTKSEIDSILAKKSADPTMTKSDREAINAYYLNSANLQTINHLLK